MTKESLIRIAKTIYENTPFPSLRRFYFTAFCRMVRNKRVEAIVDGMKYDLDLGEMIDLSLFLNLYEPEVTKAIESYCLPGFVVLDIGANIGAHCLRFSKKVGPSGRVYAFEPADYAFNKLRKNLSLNSAENVRPFRLALSDRNLERQAIAGKSSWRTDGKRVEEGGTVDFARLDDWCAANGIGRVDIVKLDVDGHEYPILKGGLETLRRFRPILLLEVGAWHFREPGSNPLEILSGLGYRFRDLKTLADYPDLAAIRKRLPDRDEEMTFSINIVAAIDLPVSGHGA
jgi:FkbM family methyltransferase